MVGNGQVVNKRAFYSNNPSLITAESYSFSSKPCVDVDVS